MRIFRRRTLTALFLALLGQFCLSGGDARAFDAASLREPPRRDLFGDELKKRRTTEDRAAICRNSVPSPHSLPDKRAGNDESARSSGGAPVSPDRAEKRVNCFPPENALAPEPPALGPPPLRSPPSR